MHVDIYDIEKFVKVNNLAEITDTVILDRNGQPTTKGLLSTEIFGRNPTDRKEIWAYINLNGWFLHPIVYKILKRLNRKIESVVNGIEKFSIVDGQLVPDENGGTGLEWLRKNYSQINFQPNDSGIARNERIAVLKALKETEAWVKLFPVCPAFYRDINLMDTDVGKVAVGDVNKLYTRTLQLASSLAKDSSGIDFVGNMTRGRLQNSLVDIYDYFIDLVKGKHGVFRQSVLGKSIDYGSRSVISNRKFRTNSYKDTQVNFKKTGVPLATLSSVFFPFVNKWLRDYFASEFGLNWQRFPITDRKTGELRYVRLQDPLIHFNDEFIKKKIDMFISSPNDRFEKIEVPIMKDEGIKDQYYYTFRGRFVDEDEVGDSPLNLRHLTWTDLLYRAVVEITENKHVLLTRYPVEDYFGIFCTEILPLSTIKTFPMVINDKVYPIYPHIDFDAPKEEVASLFVDTVQLSNLYLSIIGGDYDGDQISVRGVYTQEANQECARKISSKQNLLNILGKNVRTLGMEPIQCMYDATRAKM